MLSWYANITPILYPQSSTIPSRIKPFPSRVSIGRYDRVTLLFQRYSGFLATHMLYISISSQWRTTTALHKSTTRIRSDCVHNLKRDDSYLVHDALSIYSCSYLPHISLLSLTPYSPFSHSSIFFLFASTPHALISSSLLSLPPSASHTNLPSLPPFASNRTLLFPLFF